MSRSNEELEKEIAKLQRVIAEKDQLIASLQSGVKLSKIEINRYSRQILLPNIGIDGQEKLKKASVLVVGAGGLGCPCSLYLTGSGVGHIGILDYDVVELNNIHRQILHGENSVNSPKVDSAYQALKNINSNIHITPLFCQIDSSNAKEIIHGYDIVVDATDNVATRYLLNDACVLLKKPLVSGSALKMEGQVTVYNYKNGPCYRCVFPRPPDPKYVNNCGTSGVLGAIPGVIGILQALETIKLILKQDVLEGQLLLFEGDDTSFKRVKLRKKDPNCVVCGSNPTITTLIDYEKFCGSKANDKNPNLELLEPDQRISVTEYLEIQKHPHVLIDVRSAAEFKICKLESSINLPITEINYEVSKDIILQEVEKFNDANIPVYVVCRRGNDSQRAVLSMKKYLDVKVNVKDIIGGLHAWARDIDHDFPVY